MGHIRDLPSNKLGVDPAADFQPEYVAVKGKGKVIKTLKAAAKQAKQIILATDPDREGEAIAFHVNEVLKTKLPTTRIVFHEITKDAVMKALDHPGKIDIKLVEAQQARRILDRLVGYQLSPVLWRKVRRGLSAGRVQSVAVRLVVEREKEIDAFKPVEFWEVLVNLKKETKKLVVKLLKIDGKSATIANKKEADQVFEELKKADYQITKVKTRESKRSAWPPLMTSTMQRVASNRLGWSAKKTMREAQRLYENGLITYHRTDSVNLATTAVLKTRDYIAKKFGNDYLPEKANFYATKSKNAQGAHEAIRPTDVFKETSQLDQSADRLYRLIWERLVMSQMKPALVEVTQVIVETEKTTRNYHLTAEGDRVKFLGFYAVNEKLLHTNQLLPEINEGEKWDLVTVNPEQKFTSPPPRYTEASLIKVLEQKGIGRPSTYAPILSTIADRHYIEKKEKKLHPTAIGLAVTDFLLDHFKTVMDYQFTADMEESLDKVATGEQKWQKLLKDFYSGFADKVSEVIEKAERIKVPVETTGEICPTCKEGLPAGRQGEVVIRTGRFGKFLSCSKFPDCKYTATYKQKVEGVSCPECGGDVVVKRSKRGKQFFGCGNYPTCKWASWNKPQSPLAQA